MGNCTQNFQNVGDNNQLEHFQYTNRPPSQQPPSARVVSEVQDVPPRYIDQESIHNSLPRREEPMNSYVQQQPELEPEPYSFPREPEVISIVESIPRKVRPKLEQLDLTFYHGLGLPDYEYQPIPEEDRQLFQGVQTYELKDNYGVKYVGQWLNNQIHGNGVLMSNTSKYIGQFKRGLKHYHGRQILKEEVYEGQFEGGRRKGFGVRYTPTFTEQGTFDDELVDGDIMYLDGRIQTKGKGIDRVNQTFRQDSGQNLNQTLGSLNTDKYQEESELPNDWFQGDELENRKEEYNRGSQTYHNRSFAYR